MPWALYIYNRYFFGILWQDTGKYYRILWQEMGKYYGILLQIVGIYARIMLQGGDISAAKKDYSKIS